MEEDDYVNNNVGEVVYVNILDVMKFCIREFFGRVIVEERKRNLSGVFIVYLNINSI